MRWVTQAKNKSKGESSAEELNREQQQQRKGRINSAHVHQLRPEEWNASAGSQAGCHVTLATLCDLLLSFEVQTLGKPPRIVSVQQKDLGLAALATSECSMPCWTPAQLLFHPCPSRQPSHTFPNTNRHSESLPAVPGSPKPPGDPPACLCHGCSGRRM